MINKIKRYIKRAYLKQYFPDFYMLVFSNKKVLAYYGFLGDDNFGDNLVFESTQKLFGDYIVLPLQRHMPAFTYLYYKFYLKTKITGIIIGGGTLISESFFMEKEFLWLMERQLPVFLHGTGINEIKELNPLWKTGLKNNLYGGLRGPLSTERFKTEFIKDIDLIGDAAFNLFNRKFLSSPNSLSVKSKKVLINLGTHKPYIGEDIFRQELSLFIEYLIKENYEIQFIAFHSVDKKHGDLLKEKYNQIEVISIHQSYQNAEALFANACFAIGERLHFIVMALMVDCPIFCIMYGQKHLDLLKSLSLEHLGFMASEVSYDKILDVFINRGVQKQKALQYIDMYLHKQQESLKNYKLK